MVVPDTSTIQMTGALEQFVADDLVAYIDGHYRTLAKSISRGLAGHGMGGYGALRIGMKRPDVFSSLYIMSACCLNDGANALLPLLEQIPLRICRSTIPSRSISEPAIPRSCPTANCTKAWRASLSLTITRSTKAITATGVLSASKETCFLFFRGISPHLRTPHHRQCSAEPAHRRGGSTTSAASAGRVRNRSGARLASARPSTRTAAGVHLRGSVRRAAHLDFAQSLRRPWFGRFDVLRSSSIVSSAKSSCRSFE